MSSKAKEESLLMKGNVSNAPEREIKKRKCLCTLATYNIIGKRIGVTGRKTSWMVYSVNENLGREHWKYTPLWSTLIWSILEVYQVNPREYEIEKIKNKETERN